MKYFHGRDINLKPLSTMAWCRLWLINSLIYLLVETEGGRASLTCAGVTCFVQYLQLRTSHWARCTVTSLTVAIPNLKEIPYSQQILDFQNRCGITSQQIICKISYECSSKAQYWNDQYLSGKMSSIFWMQNKQRQYTLYSTINRHGRTLTILHL